MNKIILQDRMLVPKDILPLKAVNQRYKIELYSEKDCAKCDNLEFRSPKNELCASCPAFHAAYKLFSEYNHKYWSLPQGDYDSLAALLKKKNIHFKTVDKREEVPFRTKIKFTGQLFGKDYVDSNGIPRPNQKKLLKQWLKKQNGIIQAKPRSGKTVLACNITCLLGQRTIIMADRKELIKQFYNTFMGSKKNPPMSNIPQLQKKTGREIIRVANSPKDLKNLKEVDILLLNYQKLVRRPKDMAKLVNGKFSLLVVDEVHGSGAEGYLRVVSNCSVKHRLSLTATPRRKDNRHKLIHRIMGGVVAKSESVSLLPTITFKHSEVHPPRSYSQWHHALAWISNNIDLRKEVLRQVFKDLRNGHEVIIIPLDRKKHIDQLTKMINHQAKRNNARKGEKWPKNLAVKYYDGVDREKVLEKVDDKEPTVLVAMRSMIKQGIDFQRPSMLYVYIPMSASTDRETGAPMLEQLANRVCTPFKKPAPQVRIWLHNVGMFRSCIRGLGWNEIVPNKYNGREGKYIIDKTFFTELKNISSERQANKTQKSFDWTG